MKRNGIFLVISLVLFAAWIAWLGTQALQRKNPVVVSRSQLMISQFDIVAHVADLQHKRVKVEAVLYPAQGGPAPGTEIIVRNLADAKGFGAGGTYFVPLIMVKEEYALAGLPDDPGFPYDSVDPRSVAPRIYPYTEEVRRQLTAIHRNKIK